jgi:hypothetical protein
MVFNGRHGSRGTCGRRVGRAFHTHHYVGGGVIATTAKLEFFI